MRMLETDKQQTRSQRFPEGDRGAMTLMNREGYTLNVIVVVAAPEEFVVVDESLTVACPPDFL